MSNKHFELNRTTKTLARIFPTLLMVTPIVVSAATIDQSTSVPQDFSADTEYVINRDVTVSSTENTPAVSVSGMNVKKSPMMAIFPEWESDWILTSMGNPLK